MGSVKIQCQLARRYHFWTCPIRLCYLEGEVIVMEARIGLIGIFCPKVHTLPSFNGSVTGGDTLWASWVLSVWNSNKPSDNFFFSSGYEVYDRLSPSFAKYLETLEAVHEARFFRVIASALGNKLRDGKGVQRTEIPAHICFYSQTSFRHSRLTRKLRRQLGSCSSRHQVTTFRYNHHPHVRDLTVSFLQRTNPVTGWKSVFVNPNFTKRILGVTKDESDTILQWVSGDSVRSYAF